MKYRMLTEEELLPLEKDLTAFLIVNGLDGEAWEKLNRERPEDAVKVVASFSDAVLQVVYERLRFLEFRGEDTVIVFHLGDSTTELISLSWPVGSAIDLSTPEGIHAALLTHASSVNWFRQQKPTGPDREQEIHRMLQQGCIPSSEAFWNSLVEVLK